MCMAKGCTVIVSGLMPERGCFEALFRGKLCRLTTGLRREGILYYYNIGIVTAHNTWRLTTTKIRSP